MIRIDRPSLWPALALVTTLIISLGWAGVDLYIHRNDFKRAWPR